MSHIIEMFSYEWYYTNMLSLLILIAFLILTYFILNSRFVQKNKLEIKITQLLGVLILSRFLISYIYQISNGLWDIEHSLPFHLCGMSGILGGILLLRYNQSIYEFILLLGAPGALWSFLTPQINVLENGAGFYNPSFMYFDYFISHAAILFVPLYLAFFLKKRARPLSYYKVFIKANIIIIPSIALINIIIKYLFGYSEVNYMYLMSAPKADNPFVIETWPWYIGIVELVAFMHMVIIYLLFKGFYKIRNTINIKEKIA